MSVNIVRTGNRNAHYAQAYSDEQIHDIATRHPARISTWVSANANRRGIRFNNTRYYRLASAISRLSDSEAELDSTEQLLVALSKAKVITISQLGVLQVSYLRHDARRLSVRSIR
jgi:hypothetical protein